MLATSYSQAEVPTPMVTPTPKSDAINNILGFFSGKNRELTITSGLCMTCDVEDALATIQDESSAKEYTISVMCQQCQDKVFG